MNEWMKAPVRCQFESLIIDCYCFSSLASVYETFHGNKLRKILSNVFFKCPLKFSIVLISFWLKLGQVWFKKSIYNEETCWLRWECLIFIITYQLCCQVPLKVSNCNIRKFSMYTFFLFIYGQKYITLTFCFQSNNYYEIVLQHLSCALLSYCFICDWWNIECCFTKLH